MLKNRWIACIMKKILLIVLFGLFVLAPTLVSGDDRLHKAAYNGDIEMVKKLLKEKVDPDERDSFGGTALHAAMFQKNTQIILLLIDYGFDVNAQGRANGYTPLHDAVWANNLEAVKILLQRGAKMDIRSKDGQTPYEKAKREGKTEIVSYMDSKNSAKKRYDETAKTTYSENDVKAFVYQWFAAFDHQMDIGVFTKHLPSEKVDMYFPDFPIQSLGDFERWYRNVIDSIQWNTHIISNLQVSGDEANGFSVSVDIRWKAKTYQGESYDVNVHQDWNIIVGKGRNFIIKKHVAKIIK